MPARNAFLRAYPKGFLCLGERGKPTVDDLGKVAGDLWDNVRQVFFVMETYSRRMLVCLSKYASSIRVLALI